MARSVKKFHPELPVILFGREQTEDAMHLMNTTYFGLTISHFGIQCAKDYDLVIHLDGDTICTHRMDEIFNSEYDVAGTRDTNDQGKAGNGGPHNWPGLDPFQYLNIGVFAVRNRQFFEDWNQLNLTEGINTPFYDNGTFNKVFHSGKYKTNILDAIGTNVYYNIASVYGTTTHWDSWKDIKLVDGNLTLNNKTIKVLHMAGGSSVGKFNFQRLFSPEVARHLERLGA
jgi:hypothetical protein